MEPLRVLIVDDDIAYQQLISYTLKQHGFSVGTADGLETMKALVEKAPYSLVLLDLRLEKENGMDALPWLVRKAPHTKIIVMTAFDTIELAVESMKQGASSFLSKNSTPQKIADEVASSLYQKMPLSRTVPYDIYQRARELGLIGDNPMLRRVIDQIFRIREVNSTVLITGESGTGKELIAKAIHKTSQRADKIFYAVNCGAIPENLLESELFGYKRGAFTDAKTDRKGFFEICANGTLLLDEIADLPFNLQVKLLRVLQEGEITPLGGTQAVKVNTRVIAATNKNLEEEVRAGRFREDLYYRLSVLRSEAPPLRDTLSNVPALVKCFLEEFGNEFGKIMEPPSHEVLSRLMSYDWPGNVRELRNAIERGVALSRSGSLQLDDVFPPSLNHRIGSFHNPEVSTDISRTLPETRRSVEANYLKRVLSSTRGNISEAARISGIHRANIYRLMTRHGISINDFKGNSTSFG